MSTYDLTRAAAIRRAIVSGGTHSSNTSVAGGAGGSGIVVVRVRKV